MSRKAKGGSRPSDAERCQDIRGLGRSGRRLAAVIQDGGDDDHIALDQRAEQDAEIGAGPRRADRFRVARADPAVLAGHATARQRAATQYIGELVKRKAVDEAVHLAVISPEPGSVGDLRFCLSLHQERKRDSRRPGSVPVGGSARGA